MIMKDKLIRHGHKKSFYFLKKIGIYSASIFGAFVFLAVPVSIARSIIEEPSEPILKEESSVTSFDDLLSY